MSSRLTASFLPSIGVYYPSNHLQYYISLSSRQLLLTAKDRKHSNLDNCEAIKLLVLYTATRRQTNVIVHRFLCGKNQNR